MGFWCFGYLWCELVCSNSNGELIGAVGKNRHIWLWGCLALWEQRHLGEEMTTTCPVETGRGI